MQWISQAYAYDVKASDTEHGVRLIDGNMGDYMHEHAEHLHGVGHEAHGHHGHHSHNHTHGE